jgi:hypothetical protein
VAVHNSNTIIKFAYDTTVVGLIRDRAEWCQDYNLPLNVSMTKKLIVEYGKRRAEHALIHIDRGVVERVREFLGVNITKDLSWSTHTNTVVKRAQQCLFPPQEVEQIWHGPSDPQRVENISAGCISA